MQAWVAHARMSIAKNLPPDVVEQRADLARRIAMRLAIRPAPNQGKRYGSRRG
jgi:hypothetical protein